MMLLMMISMEKQLVLEGRVECNLVQIQSEVICPSILESDWIEVTAYLLMSGDTEIFCAQGFNTQKMIYFGFFTKIDKNAQNRKNLFWAPTIFAVLAEQKASLKVQPSCTY